MLLWPCYKQVQKRLFLVIWPPFFKVFTKKLVNCYDKDFLLWYQALKRTKSYRCQIFIFISKMLRYWHAEFWCQTQNWQHRKFFKWSVASCLTELPFLIQLSYLKAQTNSLFFFWKAEQVTRKYIGGLSKHLFLRNPN